MANELFDISGRVCIITGGGGLLGKVHTKAVLSGGGIPVLLGRTKSKLEDVKENFGRIYKLPIEIFEADITSKNDLISVKRAIMSKYGKIDILINNAANNPKVEDNSLNLNGGEFTKFPLNIWEKDLLVGLTGTMFCCQVFGEVMEKQKRGVILNISSDYGILAPDQRLYQKEGSDKKCIKPITYSVVKHGIIGLSKYLATYWGHLGIRSNTLCPSGIYNGQDEEFITRFIKNVPMGRMSVPDDYIGTILYMISDASAFMNGATVVIDGGKSIW